MHSHIFILQLLGMGVARNANKHRGLGKLKNCYKIATTLLFGTGDMQDRMGNLPLLQRTSKKCCLAELSHGFARRD